MYMLSVANKPIVVNAIMLSVVTLIVIVAYDLMTLIK
jgi:hypothetical protein